MPLVSPIVTSQVRSRRRNSRRPAPTAPTSSQGRSRDSVTLTGRADPLPQLEPAKEEDKGPIKLSRADLRKPLKSARARRILEQVDPDMTLEKLANTLFAQDPGADDGAQFVLEAFHDDNWRSLRLRSTRELSNGTVESTVYLGKSPTDEKKPKPRISLRYRPESMPTGNQLPDAVQKVWSANYPSSPREQAESFDQQHGVLGKARNIEISINGLGDKKPHVSFAWQAEDQGVTTSVRIVEDAVELSQKLTPEELRSCHQLPETVSQAWEDWSIDPEQMAAEMVKGAIAKAGSITLGARFKNGGKASPDIAVDLVGRRGKQKDKRAGRVRFKFYTKTDKESKKTTSHAYHSLLNFEEAFQGKGLAKSVLSSNFRLYEEIGIDKVDLFAAITVGGYAWAKYGWQLKPEMLEQRHLEKQIEERLESLQLKPKDRKVVDALLASKDPKKVWALADLRQPVVKDGKKTTLGKALLLGTNWSGTFDMHDPASRKRLERYLGT